MAEHTRSRAQPQIWITRSHLMALGVATCCIALLAFLVGLQVGRSQAASAEVLADAPLPLTPDADHEESLEALLREVEYARSAVGPGGVLASDAPPDLSFPGLLEPVDPVLSLPKQASAGVGATLVVGDPETAPAAPAAPAAVERPGGGWAVQIASYPTAEEADASVAALAEAGHKAYRVAALVDGQTWFRVRIGGFQTKAAAEMERRVLEDSLGSDDLLLAEAP